MPSADLRSRVDEAAARLVHGRSAVVVAAAVGDGPAVIAARGTLSPGSSTPVSASTLFEIGSITKTFTGLLLADGVVRGEVRFDQSAGELLGVRLPASGGAPVTLLELALHTSGLRRSTNRWRDLLDPDPYSGITADDLVRAASSMPLRRRGEPHYSNLGFGLLGHALSVAAGAPWSQLVAERILGPMGLADTWPHPPTGGVHQQAVGLRWGRRPGRIWRLDGYAPAGSMVSTADDMVRFARQIAAPGTSALGAAIELARGTRVGQTRSTSVAVGLHVVDTDRGEVLWHNGGTSGFRSFVGAMPGSGRVVVALQSSFTVRGPDLRAFALLRAS